MYCTSDYNKNSTFEGLILIYQHFIKFKIFSSWESPISAVIQPDASPCVIIVMGVEFHRFELR